KEADIVICGHTHHAESSEAVGHAGRPLMYCNAGCWTDHHCHYWTVEDGVARLHEFRVDQAPPEAAPAEAARLEQGDYDPTAVSAPGETVHNPPVPFLGPRERATAKSSQPDNN